MASMTRRTFLQSSTAALSTLGALQQTGLLHAGTKQDSNSKLRFGVNYVPRKNWWYCWQDWDQQSILEDLSAIADLGMDHIRIQCLWSLLQPGINYVSGTLLERTHALLDAADKAGLDVEVTVLNGWMSGINFLPGWVQPAATNRNIFTDPEIIAAEKLLFQKLSSAIGHHKRFLGFDIGNELGVLQRLNNPATPLQSDAWATDILAFCEKVAPGKFHVNGTDHKHWFADFGFTRQNLATVGSATIIHAYAFFTGALKKFGYSGDGTLHLVEFLTEFAYAYQTNPARKVWIEEVGTSTEWAPESYLTEYMDRTIRYTADTGKVWGFTWWCSHDIDPAVKGFASVEYSLGLLDLKNKPKTLGKKYSELASELGHRSTSSTNRELALVVPDNGLRTIPNPPDWTYGDRYMQLITEGKRPCIVLESRAKDEDYLRSRGVKDLIYLSKGTI